MAIKSIIEPITKAFFTNEDKHFLYFSIPEAFMQSFPTFISEQIEVVDMYNELVPAGPFTSIISKTNLNDSDIYKYSYSLQADTIRSFYKTGVANIRKDMIIAEEIYYEQKRLLTTTVQLAEKYLTGNYLVLNVQKMDKAGVEILMRLEQSKKFKGKIILVFNNNSEDYEDTEFSKKYTEFSKKKNFYELSRIDESDIVVENHVQGKDSIIFEKAFRYLQNCISILSLEEGINFSKVLNSKIDSCNFSELQKRILHLHMGKLFYLSNEMDDAIYHFNQVIQTNIDDDYYLTSLYYLSRVYREKNSFDNALKYVQLLCLKYEKTQETYLYALAKMTNFEIQFAIKDENTFNEYAECLELLKKYDLQNNYCNILLTIPFKTLRDSIRREDILKNIDGIIQLYKEIGNDYGLSTAYNWRGILLLHNNEVEDSYQWYSKCNELRTKIGYLPSIIKIRNGLSFQYLVNAKYKDAYDLLNTISSRLLEMKDGAEIIITLGNMAHALFFGQNFTSSQIIYEKILNLLKIYKLNNFEGASFLPTYNDILLYNSYVDCKKNEVDRAKIQFYNIIHNNKHVTSVNEPLKLFMDGIFSLLDGDINQSKELVENAVKMLDDYSETQLYKKVFILYEYASYLAKCNFHDDSNHYLWRGFEIAKSRGFRSYTHGKDVPDLGEYESVVERCSKPNINLDSLEEKAEKEQLMNIIHKKLNNEQFLNKIMSYGFNSGNDNKYNEVIIQHVFEYVCCSGVYLFEKKNKNWICSASISKDGVTSPKINQLDEILKIAADKGIEYQLSYYEKYQCYYMNISKYDYEGAIIILADSMVKIKPDEIEVLNLAISNIQSQLVMHSQYENLLNISSTDQLSKLKNRRALQEKLSIESEMVRRYQNRRNKHFQLSITFLDLDNFKYINDTFGHEAGDLVISKFSNVLTKVYRRVDFISRFGGDEFVILTPNTDCAEAARATERLREEIERQNFFITDLRRFLSREIYIPEDKKIGFSAGISSNFEVEDFTDMETAMTFADRALYYSKNHGKNRVTLWNDVKDSYDE